MAPKLFIIGATGYVGGDALYEIVIAHPGWEITALVRNQDKGVKVVQSYPSIRLVYGTLDDSELIEQETQKADIIYNFADSDHVGAAQAITTGMANCQSSSPSFYIHTSGTAILGWRSVQEKYPGESPDESYNDWSGIGELTSHPDSALHRNVDKIVLEAHKQNPDLIRTAIVCPPCIYGKGRGPNKTRSLQVYHVAQTFIKTGKPFVIGKGENRWNQIHVADLAKLYLKLSEAAVAGGRPATWNEEGYYLCENGEFVWGDVMKVVALEAKKQGFLHDANLTEETVDEANEIGGFPPYAFASDSRGKAVRARKLLTWEEEKGH